MIDIAILLDQDGQSQTLQLLVDRAAPASSLYTLVGQRTGLAIGSFVLRDGDTDRLLPESGDVGSMGLVHGSKVVLTHLADGGERLLDATVRIAVLDGPHAGQEFGLTQRSFEIGRAVEPPDVRLALDDACSRHQARVAVIDAGIEITDLGSRNGTLVDDVLITGPHVLKPGELVTVGDSVLLIARPQGLDDLPHLRLEDGHLLFNRPARTRRRMPRDVNTAPSPPQTAPRRRVPKMAALGPALLGIPMFLLTQNPLSLIMVAGSPLLAIFGWLDDRTSGRKEFKKKAAAYRQAIEDLASKAKDARERSGAWRLERNPGVEQLVGRAINREPEVWQREASDGDFLELRVGVLDQPSLATVEVPSGEGDADLRKLADETAEENRLDRDAPVVVPLLARDDYPVGSNQGALTAVGALDVVAIVGSPETTAGLARWLVAQLVVHHSPQDASVAVIAPGKAAEWQWAHWLPHLEQITSEDDSRSMLGLDEKSAVALFTALRKYAKLRSDASRDSLGGSTRFRPHVTLVIDVALRVPASEFTELLDNLEGANFSVILIAPDRRVIPRQTDVLVSVTDDATLDVEFVRSDVTLQGARLDYLTVEQAERVARAIAPLRDISTPTDGSAAIPNRVNLLEMLDLVPLTVEKVLSRWSQPSTGVEAPLGMDTTGVLSVELAPHGLVGGTTGAGKSELLQTYVASLALSYPPERLNFVFVDFKGGLAFNQCIDLPHQVGLITNLDAHLAERVMQSLRAELDERTKIVTSLGGGDLASLAVKYPDRTPPELVIVFDEFREAVERVPSKSGEPTFIDRVMSLARLGRQVGMHVVLATQTPDGVVTDDLKNNVDLRVALRVKTTDASRSIIGQPDAALISKRIPGRGLLQVEAGSTSEFQAGYVGGTSALPDTSVLKPSLHTLRLSRDDSERFATLREAVKQAGQTDLQIIVDKAKDAAVELGTAPQRQPWLEELPRILPLRDVGIDRAPEARLVFPIGQSDEPERQRQDWYTLDLEAVGAALIYGGSLSGKSSVLRSIAAAAAERMSPEELHIYSVDFTGSGLGQLKALPQCAATISGRETDRVRQLVATLNKLLEARLELIGQSGAGSITEFNARHDERQPLILLLVDGFFQFHEQHANALSDSLYEDFIGLMAHGHAAGIHTVLTASRSNVPPNIQNSIPLRLVLRMNSADEYSNLGLRELAGLTSFPPGRAFTAEGLELQFGVLAPDRLDATGENIDVPTQNEVLAELGELLRARWPGIAAPQLRSLPETVSNDELGAPGLQSNRIAVGLDEVATGPVEIDLERTPTFLIVGPESSGKTTAVATIASRFALSWPDGERYLLGGRRSELMTRTDLWTRTAQGAVACVQALEELKPRMMERAASGFNTPILIALDDADTFGDEPVRSALDETHQIWRDAGIVVVAALGTFGATKIYAPWYKSMVAARNGILLTPDLVNDGNIFDRRLPSRAGLELPPGRGFLLTRSGYTLIQMAQALPPSMP